METITIPYEDYKDLLLESMMYDDMNRELQFILRTCDLNDYYYYYCKSLNIDNDMKKFMNKYIPNDLIKRTKEFMKEEENVNE